MKHIIFAQIGTPNSINQLSIRAFLKAFLSSSRVVDLPRWRWLPILNLFILPFRPKKLVKHYQQMVEQLGENPTLLTTKQMAHFFAVHNTEHYNFHFCAVLDPLSIEEVERELSHGSERVVIPLYPQYSEATSELIFDHIKERFKAKCEARVLGTESFYQRSSEVILEQLAECEASCLLLSFHSYPLHRLEKGDSYGVECIDCFEEIKNRVNSVNRVQVELCYQSKFGRGLWLGPLIEDKIQEMQELGHRSIAVYCPSFIIDSLETSWEIAIDLKAKCQARGISLHYIPCLGADSSWLFSLHQEVLKRY